MLHRGSHEKDASFGLLGRSGSDRSSAKKSLPGEGRKNPGSRGFLYLLSGGRQGLYTRKKESLSRD